MSGKLIVVPNVRKLPEGEFVDDTKAKAQAEIDNPLIVPNLDPPAASTMTKILGLETKIAKRTAALLAYKQMTSDIEVARNEITDIMTDKWAGQIQEAVAGDAGKVKALNFHIKNEKEEKNLVSVTNSHPQIDAIDYGPLTHTLHITNSETHSEKLPDDGFALYIYEFFGAVEPTDIKMMELLGRVRGGKYTNHFTPDQIGKTVWYALVYEPKTAGVEPELASKVKSTVV